MNLNLFVLITIFCWGVWGIADKKALQCASQLEVIVCLYAVTCALIPGATGAQFLISPGWHLNAPVLFWTGWAALTYGASIFAYMGAMSRTEASYVLGITASYPLILQLLATVFLNEKLVPQRLLGAVIICAGLMFVGSSAEKPEKLAEESQSPEESTTAGGPPWLVGTLVVIATLAWGVYGLFDKKALEFGTPLEVYVTQRVWDVVALGVILLGAKLKGAHIDMKNRSLWKYCGISGAALAVGALCYLQALKMATASYVITITGCYPLLMYLFALFWLKEKFNRLRFIGIMLIVAGGIAVQLTQA